jgi:arylsulfatase
MGVVPQGTGLTERPAEIPAWDDATDEEKQLYARFAENYADFLSHTDHQVGRLVDALDEMGQLEDTLVIYIIGDNGSSAEGTLTGTINEVHSLNGYQPDLADVLGRIDEIGLPGTSPHYPVGWAWAGDTPFRWTKQIASHFGGTRNGTIISWPARITDSGTVRQQFHHVIDVAPTILEVVGISEPAMVNGVPQKNIEGVSMAYTFAAEHAAAPTRRHTQYFEMFGNRALYHDGWMASCRHGRLPWINFGSWDFAEDTWELYHVAEDFSQAVDVAEQHPDKLRELQDLFMAEAAKYNVLPLDDRFIERADVTLRPSYFYGRDTVTFYPGMIRLPEGSAPKTHNVTHTITVDAEIPDGGAEGVLVCLGGDTAGWTLYVRDDGHLVYHYNWFDMERYEVVSDRPVPTGPVELRCEFINESEVPGGPATVSLLFGDEPVGRGKIDKQVRGRFSVESLDIGVDALTAVDKAYDHKQPYWFAGTINTVRFDFGAGVQLSPEDRFDIFLKMD